MKFVLACLLLVAAATALPHHDLRQSALYNPDLFEGDILGFEPGDRNVIPYTQMRWQNNEIPYVIDRTLATQQALILSAMNNYHIYTCLRFKPRTTERNYIKIFSGQGCYSYVGMIDRGEQPLSLGPGCLYKGTIVHELGHAIGFFHEQNRSDRDQYLTIYWQNIQSGMETQFALLKPHENLLLTAFDHDSIMLYGNYAFSKDRTSLTMVAKNGRRLLEPYDKQGLTISDITRVKKMYNC
ncbi:astacin-like metalloprotease toxin 5 [Parasteatoda tepidariorum]|uniref:astacin-like metalloprotease toxin 5 n=1 Tax=Parasteatoda tepidariorum TaxID=114398 RepID=UPI00077F85BF|nr:astacin-like metalloprotease toxin 5 [Parasteatoda tepidariorum]